MNERIRDVIFWCSNPYADEYTQNNVNNPNCVCMAHGKFNSICNLLESVEIHVSAIMSLFLGNIQSSQKKLKFKAMHAENIHVRAYSTWLNIASIHENLWPQPKDKSMDTNITLIHQYWEHTTNNTHNKTLISGNSVQTQYLMTDYFLQLWPPLHFHNWKATSLDKPNIKTKEMIGLLTYYSKGILLASHSSVTQTAMNFLTILYPKS